MYVTNERTALRLLEDSDRPTNVYDIGLLQYGGDMRFPEVGRRCVIYIGERASDGNFVAKGTGFLVEVIRGKRPRYYLVTAHHVIRRFPNPSRFAIRLNETKDGRAHEYQSKGRHRWFGHPKDRSVDAVVYPWTQGTNKFQFTAFSSERFVVPGGNHDVGVGDEVNIVGLFRKLAGSERINPMVRTGHIAMMAEEKFDSSNYGKALFHWIESLTIKGFSGSPVFARQTVGIELPHAERDQAKWLRGAGDLYLLGLLRGILSVKVQEELTGIKDKDQRWHSGISMVVPAHQILEILNQPKLIKYEASVFDKDKKEKSNLDEETSIEPSAAVPKKKRRNRDVLPPSISRGRFFDALEKVTKRDKE